MLSVIANIIRIFAILTFSGTTWSIIKLLFLKHFTNNYQRAQIDFALSLTHALKKMGPSFIKLGQFLSTRPDLIGKDIANILSSLQDKVPAFSTKHMLLAIHKEFGRSALELFKEIDPLPIASASIAQVHKAMTFEGEYVAIKVLRPKIEHLIQRDLALFSWIAQTITALCPSLKRLQLNKAMQTMAASLKIELDLRLEAASADQLAINLIYDHSIHVPKVYWQLTAQRVCTVEWIDGVSVNDKEKLIKAGFDLNKLAGNLALSFFNQAFADGFFHADLHPGNILIMNDGRIALVDFGIMGFLNKKNKFFIAQTLYSFIKRDYARVAELHFDIGYVPASQSKEHFTIACRSIGEPIIGMKTNQISIGILMKQLFAISHDFQMELQPSLLLLQKTIITVEGVSATLYPEVNLWEFLEPYITKWAKSTFGAKAKLQNSYQASFKTLLNIKKLVDDRIATPTIIQTPTNSKKYLYFILGGISALALQLLAMRFLF